MEYINWLQISLIGLRMGVRSLLLPCAVLFATSVVAREKPLPHYSRQKETDAPFLGILCRDNKLGLIASLREGRWEIKEGGIVITMDGEKGVLNKIRKIANLINKNKNDIGILEDMDDVEKFAQYSVDCSLDPSKFDLTFGLVFHRSVKLINVENPKMIILEYQRKRLLISTLAGIEGMHIQCLDMKNKKVVSRYYYYLGYDTAPD